MDIEALRNYCLSKPGTEESFPFGPETLVFKVAGKVYLICSLHAEQFSFNVKCNPELAIELREQFLCVQPGYHMNKKHWNTILVDGSAPIRKLKEWVDHSFELVNKPRSKNKVRSTKK